MNRLRKARWGSVSSVCGETPKSKAAGTVGSKITSVLKEAFARWGPRSPLLTQSDLMCKVQMSEALGLFMTSDNPDVLSQRTAQFVTALTVLRSFKAGLTKSDSELKGHVKAKERRATNKRKQEVESAALDVVKKQAKSASEALNNRRRVPTNIPG